MAHLRQLRDKAVEKRDELLKQIATLEDLLPKLQADIDQATVEAQETEQEWQPYMLAEGRDQAQAAQTAQIQAALKASKHLHESQEKDKRKCMKCWWKAIDNNVPAEERVKLGLYHDKRRVCPTVTERTLARYRTREEDVDPDDNDNDGACYYCGKGPEGCCC